VIVSATSLVALRKVAEQAVSDMDDGPLKLTAFQTILSSLLQPATLSHHDEVPGSTKRGRVGDAPRSFSARIAVLAKEGFFDEPRSLAEVQAVLAEHGWHYRQENLSTPLVRLVRQRKLRRLHLTNGNKRVWKYSLA
jgi:hypothetical protein